MFARLFVNTTSLMIAGVIDKLAYVVFFAVISRKISQSDFGAYNLILTLIFFGTMITNFGIEYVLIRDIAKNRKRSNILFNNALLISLVISLVTWPFIVYLAMLLNYDSKVVSLICLGGVIFIFNGLGRTAAAVLKAYERMAILALVESLYSIISVSIAIYALWIGANLTALVVILIIAESIKACVFMLIIHQHFTPIKLQVDKFVIVQILKRAVPFALLMAYGIILRRTDILLLGMLRPLDDVAIYSSAVKFADFLTVFSASIIGALFPALSSKLASSQQESWQLYNNSISLCAIIGFGAAILVTVLAQPIILFLFGDAYLPGATALRWLGWTFMFSMLCGPVGTLLLAAGDQMYRLLSMCIVILSSNILLNLWLIPLYGYTGAAIATFLSTVLGFGGRLILSWLYFNRISNLFRQCWRALLSSLLMSLVLILLKDLNIFVLVFIGVASYSIFLGAFGEFRMAHYATIRIKLSKMLETLS